MGQEKNDGPIKGGVMLFNDLVKVANQLDEKGHSQEADVIDQILKEACPGCPEHNPEKKKKAPGVILMELGNALDKKGLTEEADIIDQLLKEGVAPFVHGDLKKLIDEGKTFEETKDALKTKHPNFELKKEDYDELAQKEETTQKEETAQE